MNEHKSKKSETLEVRITYDTKQKLSERAKLEKRPVSEIVRSLITTYLAGHTETARPSSSVFSIMGLKYRLFQKPKTVLLGAAALMGSALWILPSASAGDFVLDVKGEITEGVLDPSDGLRVQKFVTVAELEYGAPLELSFSGQDRRAQTIALPDDKWMTVTVTQGERVYGQESVSILVSVIKQVGDKEIVLATPKLQALYNETAQFVFETPDAKYDLTFMPRDKT